MPSIHLRTLSQADASKMALMLNNKKIWDQLRDYIPFPYTENDAKEFIDFISGDETQHVFGIEHDVFGLCGVVGLIVQKGIYRYSAEIGYWLGEEYWGKGIMTEAVGLITKYGFSTLNLKRIYSGIFEYNIASMRALEKNGYSKEAIFKKAIIKNGKLMDEHRYGIVSI